MEAIRLKRALEIIDQRSESGEPIPFSISFMTFGKRVDRVHLATAIKSKLPGHLRSNPFLVGVRVPINSGHDYPVHTRLITEINGKTVTY